jgi:hypothetical protein
VSGGSQKRLTFCTITINERMHEGTKRGGIIKGIILLMSKVLPGVTKEIMVSDAWKAYPSLELIGIWVQSGEHLLEIAHQPSKQ